MKFRENPSFANKVFNVSVYFPFSFQLLLTTYKESIKIHAEFSLNEEYRIGLV